MLPFEHRPCSTPLLLPHDASLVLLFKTSSFAHPSAQAHTFEALPARVCLFSLLGCEKQYVTIDECVPGADYKSVNEVREAIEVQKSRPPFNPFLPLDRSEGGSPPTPSPRAMAKAKAEAEAEAYKKTLEKEKAEKERQHKAALAELDAAHRAELEAHRLKLQVSIGLRRMIRDTAPEAVIPKVRLPPFH